MNEKQKMMLFVNQPVFLSKHMHKSQQKQFFSAKTLSSIFSNSANVERFRNLQQARSRVSQNKIIDKKILALINKLHVVVKQCQAKNKLLEEKKVDVVSRLNMAYLREQIEDNLQKLSELMERYMQIKNSLYKHRQQIQKMIKMTQIKKALQLQNKMLYQQNRMLKAEENSLNFIERQGR